MIYSNDNQIENNENFKNTDLQLIQNINTFGNDNIIRNSNEILFERDSNLNEPLFRPSQVRYTLPQNDDYSQMDNTKSYDVNSKDEYLDIQEKKIMIMIIIIMIIIIIIIIIMKIK